MKENRDCKIIQDLLPNYIEKLTNEETNIYIESHLKECSECKKVFENMQKDLKLNVTKKDNREVKYIKKFSNKMKWLKVIILIIVIIFLAVVGRKIFILTNLSNKAEKSITNTNYHRITYSYQKDNVTKTEIFSLENKKKIITTTMTDKGRITKKIYATKNIDSQNKYLINIYTETENSKTVELNKNMEISVEPQNALYTENWIQLFIYSIPSVIKTTTFNGKECYYIANFQNPYSSEGMYINKETGLPISTIAYEYKNPDGTQGRWPAAEYVYEFNIVTEKDFVEPDINEYNLKE